MVWLWNPNYFWYIMVPTFLISVGVQLYLRHTFKKWSKVPNKAGMTGEEVAQELFDETDLEPIPVQRTPQPLGDHYDPKANVVRLSPPVGQAESVAAMAVTSHELGHVGQYQDGSGLIKMRSLLLPAIQFSPMIMYVCMVAGFIFNMTNLLWVGLFFFGLTVLFSLLTLPVEFDASRRGLNSLKETNLTKTEEEQKGARSVLTAAALTYVAAFIGSVLQFLYFFKQVRQEKQKDEAREARKQAKAASPSRSSQQARSRQSASQRNKRRR